MKSKQDVMKQLAVVLNRKCTLVSISTTENDYGETSTIETKTNMFCSELPIMSNEFHNASQNGIKAQQLLCVYSSQYKGQLFVDYQSERYSIYRHFPRTDGYTELYCSTRLGNG